MANTTDIFSQDFDAEALVADAVKRGEQGEQEAEWSQFAKDQLAAATGQATAGEQVFGWIKKLPKNLTVGAVNAGLSMAGLMNDLAQEISPTKGGAKDAKGLAMGPLDFSKAFAVPQSLIDPVVKWRDELTRDNNMGDDITQGVAQFVVPFTAFAKAANVSKATTLVGKAAALAGAEAATVGAAFDPHDMRAADLLELGRESENRFGEVMRKLSPDGSLLNNYINYMTDREDEGPWEGRFKNVVDSLGLTAATAGLLKAVPFSMKAARYAAENTATGPGFGSKAAQGGWVGYHGTPHEVDKFDINKVGTGEGLQVYGHGLYFAEDPTVAGTYRGSNNIVHRIASANLFKHKGDWQKSAADLSARGDNNSAAAAKLVSRGKGKIEGGNLYEVDIPDDVVSRMLDFDKPLSEQSETVKTAVARLLDEADAPVQWSDIVEQGYDWRDIRNNVLVDTLGWSEKEVSARLNALGVPGVQYLDGVRKTTGDVTKKGGTRNLVLFDDKHVTIKGKE